MSALRVFVLLGAFLLFAMEPMVGRLLLPDFGGGFHVWTTSLMFFQGALFAGYLYAHLAARRAGRGHLALLSIPIALLPPTARIVGEGGDAGSLLATLAIDFGLPFIALATTGVVAQHWLAGSALAGRDRPYVLYAWSNVGSLIALLAYALVIEPLIGLRVQRWAWAIGYGTYFAAAVLAWRATRRGTAPAEAESATAENATAQNANAQNANAQNQSAHSARAGTEAESETANEAENAKEAGNAKETENAKAENETANEAENAKAENAKAENAEAENAKAENAEAENAKEAGNAKETENEAENGKTETGEPIGTARIAYWLALSAFPSMFLMAVTNLIALDAGNVPLVWVVPLALYLLTFVLAFAEPPRVPEWIRRLWPHFAAVGLFFFAGADTGGSWSLALVHLFVLFTVCAAAHAELHASRPAPARLTLFYLIVSLGGWIGGAFVALLAPSLFPGLYEYPMAIAGLIAAIAIWHRRALVAWLRGPGRGAIAISVLLIAAIAWRVASGAGGPAPSAVRQLEVRRSFYGLYYVFERATARGPQRTLVSGTTGHGRQFLRPPLREVPLGYYHRAGPLGDAFEVIHAREERATIGIVGLGVGATAAYARPGEAIDFFEIDPVVVDLARRHFHYLEDCRGAERTIVGDARLELARIARQEPARRYDLLLIDAFAGDAIPIHLLTREATELDRSLLAEDGILVFHVSNRYYDLRPPLARIARELDLFAATRFQRRRDDEIDPSQYVVMLEREEQLAPFEARGWTRMDRLDGPLWTDDHASAITALMPDWE